MFDEHASVGPRIAEIFALAEAEARELRERIGTEATGLVREARTEAKAIVDAAEHTAREITQRAERDHGAMLSELEQDRKRIRDEVNVLELCKAVAELSRIREMLGEAAGVAGRTRPQAQVGAATDETVELPAVTVSAKKR